MINKQITQINLKHLIFSATPKYSEENKLDGVILKFFEKNNDEVYTKSYKNDFDVAYSFHSIKLVLDTRQLITFASTLVEGISSYLYNIRYELAGEEHLETFVNLKEDKRGNNNYQLRITNNRKKVRKFDKDDNEHALTRYKVMISVNTIIDGQELEIVELRFTKRDVLLMLNMLKAIVADKGRIFNFIYSNSQTVDSDKEVLSDPQLIPISKIDNSIVFGSTFLHGQEILNLNYLIDMLIFGFGIENDLDTIVSKYRQIETFKYNDFILGLKINKMIKEEGNYSQDYFEYSDNQKVELIFNNRLLAGLFLFITPSQLRHSSLLNEVDKAKFGKQVLYHINLLESDIAVGFNTVQKLKTVKKTGNEYMNFFSISVLTKNRMFEEGKQGYIKHFLPGTDEPIYVKAIDSLSLGLHGKWIYFLETITKANNKEFDEDETVIRKRLHILKAEQGGQKKYTIGLYSDSENRAPLVLSIEKYDKEGEKLLEKYRQPMFSKYIKEFLMISMQSAYELSNFSYKIQKELSEIIGVEYTNLKTIKNGHSELPSIKNIPDGIQAKIGIEKIKNNIVRIGDFSDENKICTLDYNDLISLNISAANRILNGKWIPFIGEQISLSQEGYFTDLFSEVNLEEKGLGAFYAWQYFFGTAVK